MLNAEIQAKARVYSEQFAHAQPFRHVIMPSFLDPDLYARTLAEFPAFSEKNAINELGQVGRKAFHPDVPKLGPAYRSIDAAIQSKSFLQLMSDISGIPDLLYDPDYLGGGTHENRNWQGLNPHVDFNRLPDSGWHRRLNLIIYMNEKWQSDWGGSLDLHSDPWHPETDSIVSIVPGSNLAVLFETTETSWHGFAAVQLPPDRQDLSRKSFAIYLYTRTRPADQLAPVHATVYVPEGLPSGIRADAVLSAADHSRLEQIFHSHCQYMQLMYGREKKFSAQIEALQAQLAEARDHLAIPLQGFVSRNGPTLGIWSDGWMGPAVRFGVRAERKIRRLTLVLWISEPLARQHLRVLLCSHCLIDKSIGVGEHHLDIEISLDPGDRLDCELEFAENWRPAGSDQGGDQRELSALLRQVVFDDPVGDPE